MYIIRKGICDSIAPFGVLFGNFTGIDELRKAKDIEPYLK